MGYLILMARALTVLSDALQRLFDQGHVPLINVKAQQPQASCGAAADAVQKLQRLTHQVIVGFVVLVSKEILQRDFFLKLSLDQFKVRSYLEANCGPSYLVKMISNNYYGWNYCLTD